MNKPLIVTLLCVNVGLLLALVLGPGVPAAEAQALRGQVDYLTVTGRIGGNTEAVYMIDLASRRLAAFCYDRTKDELVQYRGRDLFKDFGRKKAQE